MIYLVLCRYKDGANRWQIRAMSGTFDDAVNADAAAIEYAKALHGMSWVIECELPEFRPALGLVANNG